MLNKEIKVMVLLCEFSDKATYSNHQENSMKEKTNPKRKVEADTYPEWKATATTHRQTTNETNVQE